MNTWLVASPPQEGSAAQPADGRRYFVWMSLHCQYKRSAWLSCRPAERAPAGLALNFCGESPHEGPRVLRTPKSTDRPTLKVLRTSH